MLSFQNQKTAPETDAYQMALRGQKEKLGQLMVDSAGEGIHDRLHTIQQYGDIGTGLGTLEKAHGAYKDIQDKGGKALKQLAQIHGRVSDQLEDAKTQIGNLIRNQNRAPVGAPQAQRAQQAVRFPAFDDPNLANMPRNIQQGAIRQGRQDMADMIRQIPQARQQAVRQAIQGHPNFNPGANTLADYQSNLQITKDALDADRVAHAGQAGAGAVAQAGRQAGQAVAQAGQAGAGAVANAGQAVGQAGQAARGAVGQAQQAGQNIAGAVYNRNAGAALNINRQGLAGVGQLGQVAGMDAQGNPIPRQLGRQVGRGVANLQGANAGAQRQLGNLVQGQANAVANAVNPHAQGGANALAQARNDGGNLANRVMGGAADVADEAVSTLGKVASIGGEVLDALGPVGDLLGLGMSIFGGIEEHKEQERKEQAEKQQEELVSQPIAKPTAGVGATLDTTKQQQVSATHY